MQRSKVRLRVSTPSSKKVGFSFCFFQSDAVVFLYDHKAASSLLLGCIRCFGLILSSFCVRSVFNKLAKYFYHQARQTYAASASAVLLNQFF
jgi:hypothetical protein